MQRQIIFSEHITSAGYDAATSVMEIEFTNGTIFQYSDVPQEVYDGLLASTAPDKYFVRYIKNKFPFFEII